MKRWLIARIDAWFDRHAPMIEGNDVSRLDRLDGLHGTLDNVTPIRPRNAMEES